MQNTPNYGLKKPAQSDFYNVDDFNANADIIDTEFANVNADISNLGTNKLDKTGDASNVTNTFTQASTRANLVSGEKQSTSFGKLMKWFADLKPVAWSGNASDLTEDASNRLVTDTEKGTWNAKASTAPVTTTANGLMISTDKSKLDGVATGANNYTHPSTHLPSIIVQDASNRFVTDSEKTTWNTKASTAPVTTTANGLMISTDKSKLDGVATGANNYTHPSTHPPSIIVQDVSNRFTTDTEKATWNGKASTAVVTANTDGLMSSVDKTKLDGVETGANNYMHPAAHPASMIDQDANNLFVTDSEKATWNGKLNATGKAADSEKLDGLDSSQFLRSDTNDDITGTLTFSAPPIFEAVPTTTSNADHLMYIDYSGRAYKIAQNVFARKDLANTFTPKQQFNGGFDVNNSADCDYGGATLTNVGEFFCVANSSNSNFYVKKGSGAGDYRLQTYSTLRLGDVVIHSNDESIQGDLPNTKQTSLIDFGVIPRLNHEGEECIYLIDILEKNRIELNELKVKVAELEQVQS